MTHTTNGYLIYLYLNKKNNYIWKKKKKSRISVPFNGNLVHYVSILLQLLVLFLIIIFFFKKKKKKKSTHNFVLYAIYMYPFSFFNIHFIFVLLLWMNIVHLLNFYIFLIWVVTHILDFSPKFLSFLISSIYLGWIW